jgi:hypothetical protein
MRINLYKLRIYKRLIIFYFIIEICEALKKILKVMK